MHAYKGLTETQTGTNKIKIDFLHFKLEMFFIYFSNIILFYRNSI